MSRLLLGVVAVGPSPVFDPCPKGAHLPGSSQWGRYGLRIREQESWWGCLPILLTKTPNIIATLDHQGPVSTYMTSCNSDCSTFTAKKLPPTMVLPANSVLMSW
jgi:hypothetical protein